MRRDINERIVVGATNKCDLGTRFGGLTQALRHERLIFADKTAHNQNTIQRIQLGNRHAKPRGALECLDKIRIVIAQTKINIFRTKAARKSGQ